ncbi:non-classical arabinogalactan protein 30-like [Malania oleifera]|uniref:non-classical arabinogalactan protein 30-like n=1 Tax=Malania oleifera TaxID=397392 RepID=UPI0025ADEAFE|nr:non-classical arabinogalactan protein 30-like [Malania oleifera]
MGALLPPKALVLILQLSLLLPSCLTVHGDPALETQAPPPEAQPPILWDPLFPFPCFPGPSPGPLPGPLRNSRLPRHLLINSPQLPPILPRPHFEPSSCPPDFHGSLPADALPPEEFIVPPFPKPNTQVVAVHGVVYCKSCHRAGGVDSLSDASLLGGAVVKVQCNDARQPFMQEASTDESGKFYIQAPDSLSKDEAHKCKAFLVSSPGEKLCSVATDLNGGLNGAVLTHMEEKPPQYNLRTRLINLIAAEAIDANDPNNGSLKPLALFTVGPFAFKSADDSSNCRSP